MLCSTVANIEQGNCVTKGIKWPLLWRAHCCGLHQSWHAWSCQQINIRLNKAHLTQTTRIFEKPIHCVPCFYQKGKRSFVLETIYFTYYISEKIMCSWTKTVWITFRVSELYTSVRELVHYQLVWMEKGSLWLFFELQHLEPVINYNYTHPPQSDAVEPLRSNNNGL